MCDWKWACISAVFLLGMALFVVLVVHPGGFDEQVGWYFLLLPGGLPASLLADPFYKLSAGAESAVQWTLIVVFNLVWFWGISYAAIRISRAFRGGGWKGF